MTRGTRFVGLALLVLAGGSAYAQGNASAGSHATIKCAGQPDIPVTADAEQSLPLQLVEVVACGEEVVVLADTQGYTVRVRTAAGKIGYVARYALVVKPAATQAAPPAPVERDAHASEEASQPPRSENSSKPRVYISDTASWAASGGFSRSSSVATGALYGGYNPELTDIYQDFTSDCSAMVVTQEKSKADLAVLFDKGTSKRGVTGLGGLVKTNKVTVLSRSGETLLSQTAHSTDTAVRMACSAVRLAATAREKSEKPR